MSETQKNTTISQKEALAGIRWNEAEPGAYGCSGC